MTDLLKVLLLMVSLALALQSHAAVVNDIVVLRDGVRLEGVVQRVTDRTIDIMPVGKKKAVSIDKDKVSLILYGDGTTLSFDDTRGSSGTVSRPTVLRMRGRQSLCLGILTTPADARYYEHENSSTGKLYASPGDNSSAICDFECNVLLYHTLLAKGMFSGGLQVSVLQPKASITLSGNGVSVDRSLKGDDWNISMKEGESEVIELGVLYLGDQPLRITLEIVIRRVTSTLSGSWVTSEYEIVATGL